MSVRRDQQPLVYEVLFGARLLQVPRSAIRWPLKPLGEMPLEGRRHWAATPCVRAVARGEVTL